MMTYFWLFLLFTCETKVYLLNEMTFIIKIFMGLNPLFNRVSSIAIFLMGKKKIEIN